MGWQWVIVVFVCATNQWSKSQFQSSCCFRRVRMMRARRQRSATKRTPPAAHTMMATASTPACAAPDSLPASRSVSALVLLVTDRVNVDTKMWKTLWWQRWYDTQYMMSSHYLPKPHIKGHTFVFSFYTKNSTYLKLTAQFINISVFDVSFWHI